MVSAIYSNKAAQHHNPVPNAAILRGLLVTSGILGKRVESDDYPADKGEQTALVFSYLEVILDEAGATPQLMTVIPQLGAAGPRVHHLLRYTATLTVGGFSPWIAAHHQQHLLFQVHHLLIHLFVVVVLLDHV